MRITIVISSHIAAVGIDSIFANRQVKQIPFGLVQHRGSILRAAALETAAGNIGNHRGKRIFN